MQIKDVECKSAIGKCGFPDGGFAINPYVGCGHNCQYCYARFMRRFTSHDDDWGTFVDVRKNVAEVLEKQMNSKKYSGEQIYIGTVTDPYQSIEAKYQLTRRILGVLLKHDNHVSILTKSDLVLKDLDLLKKFRNLDVNFTINTFDEDWVKLIEPGAPTVQKRLGAVEKLTKNGISVFVMMGPYWPIFTEPEMLLKKFKELGVKQIFTESLNTNGGNWDGVENVLRRFYPKFLSEVKEIFFNETQFDAFYNDKKEKLELLSKEYQIPIKIYFGAGHAAKFKNT